MSVPPKQKDEGTNTKQQQKKPNVVPRPRLIQERPNTLLYAKRDIAKTRSWCLTMGHTRNHLHSFYSELSSLQNLHYVICFVFFLCVFTYTIRILRHMFLQSLHYIVCSTMSSLCRLFLQILTIFPVPQCLQYIVCDYNAFTTSFVQRLCKLYMTGLGT